MSTRYKFTGDDVYFVTFAVVEWIDVFTRNEYREIVTGSLLHCTQHKHLNIHGWVIMTNHVHLLISLRPNPVVTLSDVMRDMKKFTAMHIIKSIRENPQESRKDWIMYLLANEGKRNSNNKNFQFWRQDNHPIRITDDAHYSQTLAYIHNNPVNVGFVNDPNAYIWSSAVDYAGKKGLLPIVFL